MALGPTLLEFILSRDGLSLSSHRVGRALLVLGGGSQDQVLKGKVGSVNG